jgi:ribosomal subunit interface protein
MPADPRSFNGREGADRQAPTPPETPELGPVEEASADPPRKQVKSTLSTKHFNLAPDVRSHVDAQLEHLLQKFGSHILSLDTHLSLIKNPRAVDEKYSAELVAAVRPAYRMKTVTVRVKAKSHDMNQAIHDMTHQMERKVRHLKEKVMKVRRHSATGGISELSANNILSGSPMSYPAEYEEAVRRARDMPPMTVQDALLNFDVEDGYRDTTNVFVFVNKDDLQVSVLYMDDSRKMKLFVPKERKTMDVY